MNKQELIGALNDLVPKNPKSEWGKMQRDIVDQAIAMLNVTTDVSRNKYMDNLELAKQIVYNIFEDAHYGIYDTRNNGGDMMKTVYAKDGLMVDISYKWKYIEVFGLTESEFAELKSFYDDLIRQGKTNE